MTTNELADILEARYFYQARENDVDVLGEEYQKIMKSLARKVIKILERDKARTLESVLDNLF